MEKRWIPVGDFRISEEEKRAIIRVLEDGKISEGERVRQFEKGFAKYVGTKHCVAVSSGTSALVVGLLALLYDDRFPKAKKGAKVITSPITYISTVNAIILAGFEPVFVDIDESTFKLKTDEIERLVSSAPEEYAGILPVHLMGYLNDMDAINQIAGKYGLFVFEDAAQAHGTAAPDGKKAGSLGLLADFSFYIAHNIQAGEMGCVTTDDTGLYRLIRQLKANGRACNCDTCTRSKGICPGASRFGGYDFDPRFTFEYVSYNFKSNEFSAALALTQLEKADWIFKRRQENVRRLNSGLKPFADRLALPPLDANVSYLAYPITIREGSGIDRKALREGLERRGVENRPLFGCLPTQQPVLGAYRDAYLGRLPMAERIGRSAFYIGCHQYLTEEDLEYVVAAIGEVLG